MVIDRMKVRKRVTDKIKDEYIKRHTLEVILYNSFIEVVEALADELEPPKKTKKDD